MFSNPWKKASNPNGLKEHERERMTIETPSVADALRGKIVIDLAVAHEIIESADYSILEA